MARILFSTMGSLGDLHPYIAVAKCLIERGHSAMIATTGEHRQSVERAGVEFVETTPQTSDQGDYQAVAERLLAAQGGDELLVRGLVMHQLRETYQVTMEAATGVDLLVSQTLGVTGPIVAEQRRLPWVATLLTPMLFMSIYDPPLIPAAAWLFGLRWLGPRFHRVAFAKAREQVLAWEAPLHALRREARGIRIGRSGPVRWAVFALLEFGTVRSGSRQAATGLASAHRDHRKSCLRRRGRSGSTHRAQGLSSRG